MNSIFSSIIAQLTCYCGNSAWHMAMPCASTRTMSSVIISTTCTYINVREGIPQRAIRTITTPELPEFLPFCHCYHSITTLTNVSLSSRNRLSPYRSTILSSFFRWKYTISIYSLALNFLDSVVSYYYSKA